MRRVFLRVSPHHLHHTTATHAYRDIVPCRICYRFGRTAARGGCHDQRFAIEPCCRTDESKRVTERASVSNRAKRRADFAWRQGQQHFFLALAPPAAWLPCRKRGLTLISLPLANQSMRFTACLRFFGHGPTMLVAHTPPCLSSTVPSDGQVIGESRFSPDRTNLGRGSHRCAEAQCGMGLVTQATWLNLNIFLVAKTIGKGGVREMSIQPRF